MIIINVLLSFILTIVWAGSALAGLAASGYAMFWLWNQIGLGLIFLGPLVLPLGPIAALLATLPITAPLLAYLKGKPGGWFSE